MRSIEAHWASGAMPLLFLLATSEQHFVLRICSDLLKTNISLWLCRSRDDRLGENRENGDEHGPVLAIFFLIWQLRLMVLQTGQVRFDHSRLE